MLVDSSFYKNLAMLGLVNLLKDMETVTKVAEELRGYDKLHLSKIHEVTKEELDILLRHLKTIAEQTNLKISAEIESNDEGLIKIFNPRSAKGSISLHYGELYLLARAVNHPNTILCDDESVFNINKLLTGICGIEVNIVRTIEYLYELFIDNKISAIVITQVYKALSRVHAPW